VPTSSDDALKRLGKRLRALRQARRLTQDEVAERAGFASGKYIGEVERGARALPYLTLVKIVELGLGISLETVFVGLPGRKPRLQPEREPLPEHVAKAAYRIAELPVKKRGHVLAAIREIVLASID
jgi:transcriptional regulator with XRE-family HTH domain